MGVGVVSVAPKVKDGEGNRRNNKDPVLPSSVLLFSVPRFLDVWKELFGLFPILDSLHPH